MPINVHKQPDASLPDPLYQQLAEIMRGRIRAGFWPAHHKLVAEPDLAAQFGVSRGTLRNAISLLMKEGLLSQVQGRGTFVLPTRTPEAQPPRSLASLLRTGNIAYTTQQLTRETIEQSDFYEPLLGKGPYLRLVRVRSVVEGPFTVMENVLSLATCGDIPASVRLDEGFYDVLEQELGLPVGKLRRSVTAIAAPEDAAPLLGVAPGSPVLHIEQLGYLSDGRVFEYATAVIRSDRHGLRMDLSEPLRGQA